jgi:hypothetical protein
LPLSTPKQTAWQPAARHGLDDLGGDRVDAREGVPANAHVAADQLATDGEEVLAVEGEQLVLDVDLAEAQGGDLLDLIDAEARGAVANLAFGPRRCGAEDARVGAAAAGEHARVCIEGEVARERNQLARRGRDPVQIALGRARWRTDDALPVAKREAADVAQVHPALERSDQLQHRLLAFADHDEIESW